MSPNKIIKPKSRTRTEGSPEPATRAARKEIEYWESAFDQVFSDFLIQKKALESYRDALAGVESLINQWEVWYKSMTADRDRYKGWDTGGKELIRKLLNDVDHCTAVISKRDSDLTSLKALYLRDSQAHRDRIRDWEEWYRSMEEDRDRHREWCEEKQKLIDQLFTDLNHCTTVLSGRDLEVASLRELLAQDSLVHTERLREWEEWYRQLASDRDRYRQWDAEKQSEIDRLNGFIRNLTMINDELSAGREFWKNEHARVVDSLQQWVGWFSDMQRDRDRYQTWDRDKKEEIDRLNHTLSSLQAMVAGVNEENAFWRNEHARVVAKVGQWVAWFVDLQKERDRFRQWDAEKKAEITRLNQALNELETSKKFWIAEHTAVVQKMNQWVGWFTDLQKERDRYRDWDADKRAEIQRLNRALETLESSKKYWITEHAAVELKMEEWVARFLEMQADRDAHRRWDAEKKEIIGRQQREIAELRQWVEYLFRHPVKYCALAFRRLLGR